MKKSSEGSFLCGIMFTSSPNFNSNISVASLGSLSYSSSAALSSSVFENAFTPSKVLLAGSVIVEMTSSLYYQIITLI